MFRVYVEVGRELWQFVEIFLPGCPEAELSIKSFKFVPYMMRKEIDARTESHVGNKMF
jgi:hypothetical protein